MKSPTLVGDFCFW